MRVLRAVLETCAHGIVTEDSQVHLGRGDVMS